MKNMFVSLFKLITVNMGLLSDQGKSSVPKIFSLLPMQMANDLEIKHIGVNYNNILFQEEEAIKIEEEFNKIGVAITKSSSLRHVILTRSS